MTRSQLLTAATAIVASVSIIACDGRDSSSPMAPSASSARTDGALRSLQSGDAIHVTKDCSLYTGHAGDTCTVTSSNFRGIKVGSTITYASDASATGWLDTDIVIDAPGLGTENAVGHCSLDLVTGDGECTVRGEIRNAGQFRATVIVSHVDGPSYAWDGTYVLSAARD